MEVWLIVDISDHAWLVWSLLITWRFLLVIQIVFIDLHFSIVLLLKLGWLCIALSFHNYLFTGQSVDEGVSRGVESFPPKDSTFRVRYDYWAMYIAFNCTRYPCSWTLRSLHYLLISFLFFCSIISFLTRFCWSHNHASEFAKDSPCHTTVRVFTCLRHQLGFWVRAYSRLSLQRLGCGCP